MGLHTIYTLQFTYGNAFCFTGAPTFFRGLPYGFGFSIRFSARVQALSRARAVMCTLVVSLPCVFVSVHGPGQASRSDS